MASDMKGDKAAAPRQAEAVSNDDYFVRRTESTRSSEDVPEQVAAGEVGGPRVVTAREKKWERKGKGGRAGSPNYSAEDIERLLDCVEHYEPLGANEWALVHNMYKEWAESGERPVRDQMSLKSKFDKLANTKKRTGDPSCPSSVRRAKHIARDILKKCSALTISGESSSESESGDEEGQNKPSKQLSKHSSVGSITEATRSFCDLSEAPTGRKGSGITKSDDDGANGVGRRSNKRKSGMTGVSISKRRDIGLIEHVAELTKHVGTIAQSMMLPEKATKSTQNNRGNDTVGRAEVIDIIRTELQSTNSMIEKIMEVVKASNRST